MYVSSTFLQKRYHEKYLLSMNSLIAIGIWIDVDAAPLLSSEFFISYLYVHFCQLLFRQVMIQRNVWLLSLQREVLLTYPRGALFPYPVLFSIVEMMAGQGDGGCQQRDSSFSLVPLQGIISPTSRWQPIEPVCSWTSSTSTNQITDCTNARSPGLRDPPVLDIWHMWTSLQVHMVLLVNITSVLISFMQRMYSMYCFVRFPLKMRINHRKFPLDIPRWQVDWYACALTSLMCCTFSVQPYHPHPWGRSIPGWRCM